MQGGGGRLGADMCVGLQDRRNVNGRMRLFIVEVLVFDLKWNPGVVSGSCDSLWRPRYESTNYCEVNRGVIGLHYAEGARTGKLLDLFGRMA